MGTGDTITDEATFPLLADAQTYVACTWDLTVNADRRRYWLGLFRRHFPMLLEEAVAEVEDAGGDVADATRRAAKAKAALNEYLDEVAIEPGKFGRLDILEICWRRERVLRAAGFSDPYRLAKQRENETAAALLPALLADLDAMEESPRRMEVMRGVFAGNIFDLGASRTMELYADGAVDFHATRHSLRPRPWFRDDLDAWVRRLDGSAHRAAVIFVDNAGPDVTLGILPFARELLKRGTRVILTANSQPSLNDVTDDELNQLVQQVAAIDAVIGDALSAGSLYLVESGNWAPLIDLTRISAELAEAAAREPVDLVVLEGMGRAIESNLRARFTCEALKLAMVKDQGVAEGLGAEVFDLMMRYEP